MIWQLDILILVMLVVCAVAAVSVKGLLSAAIILSGYSFLMSLLWTEMASVDVAFTEAAVGAGVSTVFLVAVVYHTKRRLGTRARARYVFKGLGFAAALATAGLLVYGAQDFPAWGDPASTASSHVSPHYIEKSVEETSVPNVVTAVLADYRGYDTMFETAVIYTAGIAVLALLRRRGRRKDPARTKNGIPVEAHKSSIAQFMVRQLVPFIQLFALYVVAHGHHSPGGGFQGGVILAASFVLLGLSFNVQVVRRRVGDVAQVFSGGLGVLLYVGVGLLCLGLGGAFLDYGTLARIMPGLTAVGARSYGILFVEIGVAMAVTAIMLSIYLDLASRGYRDQGL